MVVFYLIYIKGDLVMEILFELLYNLGILVSISIISGFIGHRGNRDWKRSIVQGLIFGSAAVIGMIHPLVVSPGLVFDGRSVVISLAGLFFGPISAIVSGLMALILRINQGGTGVIMGTLVIISSAGIGSILNIRNKGRNIEVTIRMLFYMGLIVHVAMIVLMFTLPGDRAISTIKLIGVPILLSYPIATVLIGRILLEANERRRMVDKLRESERKLTCSNEELNASFEELAAIEEELRSQFEELQTSNELLVESEEVLKISEEKYRLLTEQASDVIWVLNFTRNKYTYISPSIFFLRGLTVEEAINERLEESLTTESLMNLNEAITRYISDFTESIEVSSCYINEIQQPCKNGDIIWVEVSTRCRYNADGEIEVVGVSRNIEERKRLEKEILYLSYNDQLTGLYNRRFYEEELKRLDTERNLPMTIVMGDVNGLKLINDSFGHAMGDELLKKVAEVIRFGCRADDIIARLGGDEFVILLPKTNAFEADEIIKRIKEKALKEKVGSMDISISFGCETKINEQEKIQDIFKKAEDYMYKKKLFESPSMRGKTIKSIITTLHEKNKREEQHSHRVSILCENMGEALNLLEREIQELKTVGLLHDIGKIAIEENILNKPGKLTEDEWKEIKRHPEIGYRILSTVNDMADMANCILHHHERWDGQGYPKGLKEEEIPLVSRIITIADAYDAMTSERSYRSALTDEVAIGELQKNTGVQFDPKLVGIFIEKVLGQASGL
jgi:diguanylate cyclase (GGDEF)-like protein/PAS domain S-box-containing protein